MANKHTKRRSTSLVIIRYHFKQQDGNNQKDNYFQGCGEIGILIYCWSEYKNDATTL